jgi:hypothetical protein
MGFFYVDDSKHPSRGDFVVGGIVYAPEDPSARVNEALRAVGLRPGIDEFKSRALMSAHPEQAKLRDLLGTVLHESRCRTAAVVCPFSRRQDLGGDVLQATARLVALVNAEQPSLHTIYFDQEILPATEVDAALSRSGAALKDTRVCAEQDSQSIAGIQLADLVAHAASTMILCGLGLVNKVTKAPPNSGYDPPYDDLSLGFELFVRNRFLWFVDPDGRSTERGIRVTGAGLFISKHCPESLRAAAEARLGSVHYGCIH